MSNFFCLLSMHSGFAFKKFWFWCTSPLDTSSKPFGCVSQISGNHFQNPLEFISKPFGFHIQTLWISFPNSLDFLSKLVGFHFQTLWVSFPNSLGFISKPFGSHFQTLWISFPNSLDFISKLFGYYFQTLWISLPNPLEVVSKPVTVRLQHNECSPASDLSLALPCFSLLASIVRLNTRKKNCIPHIFSRFSIDFPII